MPGPEVPADIPAIIRPLEDRELDRWLRPAEGGHPIKDGPTYGNWGGGGYNGGMRDDTPACNINWQPPINKLDEIFRDHDYDYMRHGIGADTSQSNPFKQEADQRLIDRLSELPNSELDIESLRYKLAAQGLFSAKVHGQEIKQDFVDAYESAKQAANKTWEATKNTASDAWDSAKNTASDAWDSAKNTASGASDWVSKQIAGGGTPEDVATAHARATPSNPLGISDTEGKSIGQRIDLGEGQYLGLPQPNPNGSYNYPVYNEDGSVAGSIDINRNPNGSLSGTGSFQRPHVEGDAGMDGLGAETGYTTGSGKEYDIPTGKTENTGSGWDGAEVGATASAEGNINAFVADTFKFEIDPDGSGYAGKITNTFGQVEGELTGGGALGVNDEGEFEANIGGEGSIGAKAAEGLLSGETFWPLTTNPDGTCEQPGLSGEGGAFLGAGAGAKGEFGLDGLGGKLYAGLGGGLTAGGNMQLFGNFECANPFASLGGPGTGPSALADLGSSGLGGASGGSSQSIVAMEDQADDQADECDQHADRAETAARRAQSSARRAAAIAARIRAMMSRRRSY
jgi:hypothetical protein